MTESSGYFYRLWDLGQRQLAAGRYVAARGSLELAAEMAVRAGDVRAAGRIYLPLLEARRLIRYRAAEGRIWVVEVGVSDAGARVKAFEQAAEGTVLLAVRGQAQVGRGVMMAQRVARAARRSGRCLEALLLVRQREEVRMVAPGAAAYAGGVAVKMGADAQAVIGASTDAALVLPLPGVGEYEGRAGLGALAREALLIGWEALGLRWQSRHPLRAADGWEELQWLRRGLKVDPASEPMTMRLMAVAEGLERASGR